MKTVASTTLSTSRVYDVAIKTPLEQADKLRTLAGCAVYLKREDLQPVHSFKLRGAYNKIVQLTEKERAVGVITASAGNHAQGVALAAQTLGISALIVMPRTTPSIKIDAVKSYGATIELAGNSYSEAAEYCHARIQQTGRTYIHPFDDPLVIAGQGTVGQEIITQLAETTHIFVPVGGGGLIAGIADYVKKHRPDIKIISVEPEDSNALQASIAKNERVVLPRVGIFADGVAVKQIGSNTYQTAREKVDDFITVTTDEICMAIKHIFEDTRSIVEPAGALAVAGILRYKLPSDAHAVAICSGANMTFERLQQVTERTAIHSAREAIYAVILPETPTALRLFLSEVLHGRTINQFEYRLGTSEEARILVGVTINDETDKQQLEKKMEVHGAPYTDLTYDNVTKEHVRHMIGNHTAHTAREHMYEITFLEQPGATAHLLEAIGDSWNVRLFHYKNAASDSGNVLIGFDTADSDALETQLQSLGLRFTTLNTNAGVDLFIRTPLNNHIQK